MHTRRSALQVLAASALITASMVATPFRNLDAKDLKVPLRSDYGIPKENPAASFGFIGESQQAKRLLAQIKDAARRDKNVLLVGESGTGKQHTARIIHRMSDRCDKPIVSVSLGSIPNDLIEPELIGWARGARKEALHNRVGRFALADGGTLFLDNIDILDESVRQSISPAVARKKFTPLGSIRTIQANARVISSCQNKTQKNSMQKEENIVNGDFERNLAQIEISVPPLRDRKSDIPLLVEHFAKMISEECSLPKIRVPEDVMRLLVQYEWPDNIRQLQNLVERLTILAEDKLIEIKDLPERIRIGEDKYLIASNKRRQSVEYWMRSHTL
jgi:two-component system, NtrC family, nitrogen regulation response regulator NtrX